MCYELVATDNETITSNLGTSKPIEYHIAWLVKGTHLYSIFESFCGECRCSLKPKQLGDILKAYSQQSQFLIDTTPAYNKQQLDNLRLLLEEEQDLVLYVVPVTQAYMVEQLAIDSAL